MIKALAHLCVFSNDLKRSRAFYCEALGLQKHFEFHKNGKLFGFYLQVAPGQFLEIFQTHAMDEIRRQRIHHFCLEVENIDALREKLLARGIAVTPKKLGCDQSWQCWCKDPDGTELEFQQYTPQSSQFTKTDCVVDW
jgi:lactoylglutathione lyase/glyoxylase I family protein